MKFRINLASQPYENVRRFYLVWGIVLVVVALLTGALVYGAVAGWRRTHAINQRIAVEENTLQRLNAEEQQDLVILNRPENRDVRDKSQVLNSLIRRKEFSWTLIFADLERLMPTRLHVVSISPELNANNDIDVHMIVAGDSREKAIELVHNMEKSPEFRHAQVLAETNLQREGSTNTPTGADTIQFEIAAQYVPGAAVPGATQERGGQ